MVDVVRGDSPREPGGAVTALRRTAAQGGGLEAGDGASEAPVLFVQQSDVVAPLPAVRGPLEPVAPLGRERASSGRREPPPDGVLPVGRVHDELPDVVAAGSGPPRDTALGKASDRASQVRAMPGLPVVRLVDEREKKRPVGGFSSPAGVHEARSLRLRPAVETSARDSGFASPP